MFRASRHYYFRRYKFLIALIILIFLFFLSIRAFLWIEDNLRPTFLAIAEARAKIIAFNAINEAINERVAQNIMYEDLVLVEKDNDGKIVMAQTNTMEVNRVQAETVRRVQNTLKKIQGENINIPLGQVLGSQILASYGPKIPVTLVPIGTVHVDVSHSFKEAGINQTRHKIYLEVFADVQIVIPFVSTSREVNTAIPVADTLYLGDVPDTVVNLPLPTKQQEDIMSNSNTSQNKWSFNQENDDTQNEWSNEWSGGDFSSGYEEEELNQQSEVPFFNR